MTKETNSCRSEKVYVLYGSQMGNSEQAAVELCSQMATRLSPVEIQRITGTMDEVNIQPVHMQLDDFLEIEKCTWTRLLVIITSSYGVGQAPLGCYRYRDLCDAWYKLYKEEKTETKAVLDGVSFALCGLGDSKYPTYFQNPTRIDEAMRMVGAKRVGPLGKADASGTGNEAQATVVREWVDGIWPYLAKVVAQSPTLSVERLEEMQMDTVRLCQQINPDFVFKEDCTKKSTVRIWYAIQMVVALLAILYYFHINTKV